MSPTAKLKSPPNIPRIQYHTVNVCACHMYTCVFYSQRVTHYILIDCLQERQLKGKLDKQLREKEDYILQVLAQKRKLEEQLNVKEKEQVSLQQVSMSSTYITWRKLFVFSNKFSRLLRKTLQLGICQIVHLLMYSEYIMRPKFNL